MKAIIIKTQDQLYALPNSFDEFTIIKIESTEKIYIKVAYANSNVEVYGNSNVVAWESSRVVAYEDSRVEARDNSNVEAYGNSRVEARDNSNVEAWDNSNVEAYGNSSAMLFMSAYALVLSSYVTVKKLLDYSTAVFKGCKINIQEKSETAHAREIPKDIEVDFNEWLRRGYIQADGIMKKLMDQKKIGEIEVFECEDFPKKTTSYVVKRGDTFSHGETVEKAIEALRYKISDRDTSRFEPWRGNLEKEISLDDAIAAYRTITGACEFGVKEFVESVNVPDKLTPNVIFKLTEGKFGSTQFKEFFK